MIYGEVPERPKGTDCKSVGEAFGGSNPPLPTFFVELGLSVSGDLLVVLSRYFFVCGKCKQEMRSDRGSSISSKLRRGCSLMK